MLNKSTMVTCFSALIFCHATEAYLKITPSIELNEIYSDNVDIVPRVLRQSEWITEIMPKLTVEGKAKRATLDGNYLLEGVIFANNTQADKLYQRADLHYTHDLAQNDIQFHLDGVYTQQVLFPADRAFNSITNTQTQTNVGTFQLGPDVRYSLGRKLTTFTRVRYGQSHYNSTGIGKNEDISADIVLQSGPIFYFLRGSIQGSWRQTTQRDDLNFQTYQINGQLQYIVTRRFQFILEGGYEDARNQRGVQSAIEGLTWYAGFFWIPTKRTSLSVKRGERAFGGSTLVDLNWRRRRHLITLSYVEDITNYTRQQIDAVSRINVSNSLSSPTQFVPTFNNQILISKRFDATYSYQMDTRSIRLNIFHVKDNVVNTQFIERGKGINLSLESRINPRTNLSLTSGYVIQRFFNFEEDKRFVAGAVLQYQPTRMIRFNASINRFNNDSDIFFRNTHENLAYVGVTILDLPV